MDSNVIKFFEKMPEALPLYESVERMILAEFEQVTIKVQKSQIAFSNKHNFAFVWLPIRKIKGRPDVYIILSFGIGHEVDDPRIVEAVEPYPNRWTHHVIIQREDEIDGKIREWLKAAYQFSMNKD